MKIEFFKQGSDFFKEESCDRLENFAGFLEQKNSSIKMIFDCIIFIILIYKLSKISIGKMIHLTRELRQSRCVLSGHLAPPLL